jgi:restriction system protein
MTDKINDTQLPSSRVSGTAKLLKEWRVLEPTVTNSPSVKILNVDDHVDLAEPQSDIRIIPATGTVSVSGSASATGVSSTETLPEILLQQVIEISGNKVNDGQLIHFVNIPWNGIFKELARDPFFLSKFDWRKMEELIAAAYKDAGCPEVVLTPRSRDKGRDVIATWPNIVSIRVIDQVKTYNPNHEVTADEVRTMLGVLQLDRNVSKGIVTTTSRFAPEIVKDPDLSAFMPNRLELRDGNRLNEWLKSLLQGEHWGLA